MQISPVKITPFHFYINKPKNLSTKSYSDTKSEINFKGISNAYCADFDINKPKYEYKTIASVKPIYEPIGEYNDLDEFSELFAQKINSQLLAPTEDDIENLINRIQFKTKASRKTIKEVLYNLTAFSGYKSFDE